MSKSKIDRVEIQPNTIIAKPGEEFQLIAQIWREGANSPEKAESPSWQSGGSGYVDGDGKLKVGDNTGDYTVFATISEWDDETKVAHEILGRANVSVINSTSRVGFDKTLEEKQEIKDIRVPGVSDVIRKTAFGGAKIPSVNLKEILDSQKEEEEIPKPKSKIILKKLSNDDLAEKAAQKRTVFGHSRALYRTLIANGDLAFLGLLCFFAVSLGCCTILLIYGFSTEKTIAFLASFLGAIFSFLAKLYTPPGEISEALSDKISGATDEEKIQSLEKKLKKLTTRVQKKNQPIGDSFYKYSITEENQPF